MEGNLAVFLYSSVFDNPFHKTNGKLLCYFKMLKIICLIMLASSSVVTLYDVNQDKKNENWQIVNDNVMGGRSKANIEISEDGLLHYFGEISLENNGGFSSLRYKDLDVSVSANDVIRLTVKGDGNKYQFRVTSEENPGFSYITYFKTISQLTTIDIKLKYLYPSFRGRKLNLPNFENGKLRELGILFGNKKEEKFSLKIQKVELIRA